VRRLAAASKCAAVIDDVPVAESARAMAQARGEDAQRYALAGGEDFELLAAIDGRAFDHLRARFYKRFARPLFAVGVLREGSGVFERTGASETELAPMGWDHLA
jgi:thiamine monophosphate kinase